MENFEGPQNRVKEKSVYLLHLDTARIILIVAVVIGLIIASFLFGMNYLKKGENTTTSSLMNNNLFDEKKDISNIPAPPDSDELSKPGDEKMVLENENDKDQPKKDITAEKDNSESTDLLTKENIKEVITPLKDGKKEPKKKIVKESKISKSKNIAKNTKKAEKKKIKPSNKKKGNVIEVADKSTEYIKKGSTHFSIQIASYDNKSRAQKELTILKKMKYDAFIDKTTVNGKQYYRVRIGPLTSKRKALDLLNNIQEETRYQESYMIKD